MRLLRRGVLGSMAPVHAPRAFVLALGLGAVLGLSPCAPLTRATDQPQWGERDTRNMVSSERNLPATFDAVSGRNLWWKAALGTETHGTPVIGQGRVLLGTNNGRPRDARHQGDRGVLMCFEEGSGQFLWQLVVPKLTNSIYWDWPNAGLCSPATIEGDRAYVVSNRGEMLCLDLRGLADGNDGPYREEGRHSVPANSPALEPGPLDADIVWRFDLIRECGVRQHDSAHGSILIHGDYLYVNTSNGVDDTHKRIDAPDAPSLIVVDKTTGRLVAQDGERIGPRIFHSTWSSPALSRVEGRESIVFCGGDGVVYGFEPVTRASAAGANGGPARLRKVWSFDCDPTAPKENVHQYNSNRRVSPSNIKSVPVCVDGRVYVTVGGDLWWGKHEAWLKCIDVRGTGDLTATAGVWSYALVRHCMASPAVQDGLVFVGDSGERVHCVDAASGQGVWTHDVKGEVWASPLVADGKVYFATRRGQLLVFAAGREKNLLTTLDLGSPVSATPVAANGVLYLATMRDLYALSTTVPRLQP